MPFIPVLCSGTDLPHYSFFGYYKQDQLHRTVDIPTETVIPLLTRVWTMSSALSSSGARVRMLTVSSEPYMVQEVSKAMVKASDIFRSVRSLLPWADEGSF